MKKKYTIWDIPVNRIVMLLMLDAMSVVIAAYGAILCRFDFSIAATPDLDEESRRDIIGCLKDLTGLETQTLTLHKTVGEKLTAEQKAAITAKNWTLVY